MHLMVTTRKRSGRESLQVQDKCYYFFPALEKAFPERKENYALLRTTTHKATFRKRGYETKYSLAEVAETLLESALVVVVMPLLALEACWEELSRLPLDEPNLSWPCWPYWLEFELELPPL